jgi:hypothetical protein
MQPVGVDPRWDAFGPFHDYLFQAFPLVYVFLPIPDKFLTARSHSTLSLTKVNAWGMVYVWPGSDESLKPALFTAHQGAGYDSLLDPEGLTSCRCRASEPRHRGRMGIPPLLWSL